MLFKFLSRENYNEPFLFFISINLILHNAHESRQDYFHASMDIAAAFLVDEEQMYLSSHVIESTAK